MPPECISILSPRMALAMTEHSICQPGRPAPQGEGQEGSPGLEAFQSAKSEADRRPVFEVSAPEECESTNRYVQGMYISLAFALCKQLSIAFTPRL
jgi:hypothetical protein